MKMILAFIQPYMAPQVVHALHRVAGLTGATFTDAKGFGRGRSAERPVPEVLFGTADKVRVEVIVRDELQDAVVAAIRRAAHTGKRGDGKVYILPVAGAVRIATGEEGEDAA